VHYEDASTNPYLSDFYDDMQRWSFNLQIYFLNSRYKQILEIQSGDRTIIQDRTIYEDANIFAPNLHEMGLMSKRDIDNYLDLFETMSSQVNPPDLLIYLQSSISTLVSHIQSRGRDYEGNMSLDYLKRLNEKYENWISNYTEGKLLIINVDNIDFKNNKEDLGGVIELVNSKLHGLF
jgi:deoxyadenosine/deoxycytidine kinase